MEFDKYKITQAVTAVKNKLKNKEGGRDLAMNDYFKTLREPLIKRQKETNKRQDQMIEKINRNQGLIIKGIND